MAEDYVSRDQHRADMAELRLELGNSLASLDKRTELIAQDLIALRREMNDRFDRMNEQMTERFDRMDQQRQEDRQVMLQQFQQADQRHSDLLAAMNQRFAQHETRLMSLENWMRTTFVTVAVVAVGVAAQLLYTLMRLGLKPPTGGP